MAANASSRHACTVRWPSCRCHPAKSVPSYSIRSRSVRAAKAGAASELEHQPGQPGGVTDVERVVLAQARGLVVRALDEQVRVVDADARVQLARGAGIEEIQLERQPRG